MPDQVGTHFNDTMAMDVFVESVMLKGYGSAAKQYPDLQSHLVACDHCRDIMEMMIAISIHSYATGRLSIPQEG